MSLLPIPDLAQAIQATGTPRVVFGALYRAAQLASGVPEQEVLLFEAVAPGVEDDRWAYQLALTLASQHPWFEKLENLLISGGLAGGELMKAAALASAGPVAPLQANGQGVSLLEAMAAPEMGFAEPDEVLRGIQNASRWTAKIRIRAPGAAAAAARGTGILIRPNLILTAWHVVHELFELDVATGQYQPLPGSAERLVVEFDDILRLIGRGGRSRTFPVHPQWCVAFSPATQAELQEEQIKDLATLDRNWDYAILRLEAVPGLERRWCIPKTETPVPGSNEPLTLFQHPDGQPLKAHFAAVAAPLPQESSAIPGFRFLHSANSLPGSSGGPCFNRDFFLVGIHQGEWPRDAAQANGTKVNRGIPLQKILRDLEERKTPLPPPEPEELVVWHLDAADNYAPAIGCDDFQATVWSTMAPGSKRILSITGPGGSGKSFRTRVLVTLLRALPEEHLAIVLDSETLSTLNGRELAAHVMRRAAAGSTAPDPPALVAPLGTDSTGAVWIRDEVIPKVISRLEKTRAGRVVWLVLRDLNRVTIGNGLAREFASDLLFRLYEEVDNLSWLRIVLDDPQTELPDQAKLHLLLHPVDRITEAELEIFLRRYLAAMDVVRDDAYFADLAGMLWGDYDDLYREDPSTAMKRYLEKLSGRLNTIAKKSGTTLSSVLAGGVV